MGRMSKRSKQSKGAWKSSYDTRRSKRQRIGPDTTAASAAAAAALPDTPPPLSHATTTQRSTSPPLIATPQPSTSHAEESKRNNKEKASLLNIRETLLQDIHKQDEDVESDDEIVMLTKRRLKNILFSSCSCPDPAFEYSFQPDLYENTITKHCNNEERGQL